MPEIGPWYCDTCDNEIGDAADGYVIWRHSVERDPHDFRIIHQGRCDNKAFNSSLPLKEFLGPDGLAQLLGFLSVGPLKLAAEPVEGDSRSVGGLDDFVDFFRRVQTPGYEELRRHFGDEDLQRELEDSNEVSPYLPATISRLLKDRG